MNARHWLSILCFCLTSCAQSVPTTAQPTQAAKTAPANEPIFELTPKDLFEAYAENEGEGGKQYTGQVVKVEGVVRAVSSDEGKPCLLLYVPAQGGKAVIRCSFERETEMADVKPGGNVTIRGRCRGPVNQAVTVDDCAVLRYRAPKD